MRDAVDLDGEPFDAVAGTYDRHFSDTSLGNWLRAQVREVLDRAFPPDSRIFEIGCGTGEDALWFAGRGTRVVAADPSEEMLRRARAKAGDRESFDDRLQFVRWNSDDQQGGDSDEEGLHRPPGTGGELFDGAYSGFGAINCIRDRRRLWRALEQWLQPGAALVVVVMGPFCLVETVSFLARARPRQAVRRWRSPSQARVGGHSCPVWYPSVRRLADELGPSFVLEEVIGIGTILPPSDHALLVDRCEVPFRLLAAIDPFFGRCGGHWIADHYLAWFVRGEASR